MRVLLLAFWDYRCEGGGRIPPRGGVIVASTHQSHLDPVMVQVALLRRVGYVARSTLFRNGLFAWLIRSLGAVSFDREAPGAEQMRGIIDALEVGNALTFFPEGTRSRDGEIGRLRPGIALLARKTAAPVLPVAVEGTFRCWPRSRRMFRPGRVRVVCGEPVTYGRGWKRAGILRDLGERLSALQQRARELA